MTLASADRARDLEVFCAVADSGSFSAAGRGLGLTPSAVSRTLDRIEARLGARLLLRSTRALTLTAEGQAYLTAARRILADLDEAEQAIADQGAPRGRIRVSAALSHGRLCIVPLLGEFVRRYPNIRVDIHLGDGLVDVAAGQADVAIRGGPLADSALTARRLSDNGRSIVASPDYLARWGVPQTPEDLHHHNCLNFSFRRAEPVWPFRRDGVDYALKLRGAIEANSGDTLTELACDGVGIARVGDFSLGNAVAQGRLVRLLEAYNPGDREVFHAVFVGGANTPARVRVFVDYLVERMAGSPNAAMRRGV
ncbi:putative transcriptional regulatory protein, LysR family [Bradyrhizobium sp. ORS 375]|uniref:LysR family transcriptional regulator n=1 Tax=Bradyrhizobium sp. (strain ORS 375) TaxID=566679 RepID=UPI000240856B|nr:LysR family transcriptional regulator [Bradyrhizobium sp. ORS 375]CCD92061.1 putative transcriptional regulatory protein, LysR family [Bradyrhizobium sp. ORS 375]